jgi:hypothetical protein
MRYEVVVRGQLGPQLASALEGFDVVVSDAQSTRLIGTLPDQAALQGLVRRLADFGLELISLRPAGGSGP